MLLENVTEELPLVRHNGFVLERNCSLLQLALPLILVPFLVLMTLTFELFCTAVRVAGLSINWQQASQPPSSTTRQQAAMQTAG
jgi:hypothetical protein